MFVFLFSLVLLYLLGLRQAALKPCQRREFYICQHLNPLPLFYTFTITRCQEGHWHNWKVTWGPTRSPANDPNPIKCLVDCCFWMVRICAAQLVDKGWFWDELQVLDCQLSAVPSIMIKGAVNQHFLKRSLNICENFDIGLVKLFFSNPFCESCDISSSSLAAFASNLLKCFHFQSLMFLQQKIKFSLCDSFALFRETWTSSIQNYKL